MYTGNLIVLKFGGSVLRCKDDQFIAAQEIYRWYRAGYQVVAVVSALYGRTDELFAEAKSYGDETSPYSIAKLVGSAERESAALLGLTLDQCGVPNSVLLETEVQLTTCGSPLDAAPISIDVDFVHSQLKETPVIVIPGFVGRDKQGRVNLFGRGGSDLTALFVANALNADRCRLIKDVDGLYEFDPKLRGGRKPERWVSVSWSEALKLDKSILQPKAIKYARKHEIRFEVATSLGSFSTKVGPYRLKKRSPSQNSSEKLKIGILGCGAVGQGVVRQLNRFREQFEITGVAVRDIEKHTRELPESLLTNNWRQVVESDCDVVVELMGGLQPAQEAVTSALQLDKHVVTANKTLLARCDNELGPVLIRSGKRLLYSAAVGGCVPMLETVRYLNKRHSIFRVYGILNGTTNFILDSVAQGDELAQAVLNAQQKGLAEADPQGDLNGIDAAEKLVLLSRAAKLDVSIDRVEAREFDADAASSVESPKQVAALEMLSRGMQARVGIQSCSKLPELASTCGSQNVLIVDTVEGSSFVVRGSGAGRWPTTMAVMADLFKIRNQIRTRESTAVAHKR